MSSALGTQSATAPAAEALQLPLARAWTARRIEPAAQRPASPAPRATVVARDTRATPGVMRLRAVQSDGRVTDFMWVFVSAAAARLLHCNPQQLHGKCMSEVRAGLLSHPALIARYRRVVEQGTAESFEQVHLIDGEQDIVVHRVARLDAGVVVKLTNLSADRRARSLRQASIANQPIPHRPFK